MLQGLIIVLLIGLVAYQQWLHARQVRDLTLKIKSRDMDEYLMAKAAEETAPPGPLIEEPKPLDGVDPDTALEALTRSLKHDDGMEE